MENLNKLESSLLEKLSLVHPSILCHIPFLKVNKREITGVGMLVNFYYINSKMPIARLGIPNGSISTNENIEVAGLKYGLGYEVNISKDRLKYIEFITYGEEWNGDTADFRIVSPS